MSTLSASVIVICVNELMIWGELSYIYEMISKPWISTIEHYSEFEFDSRLIRRLIESAARRGEKYFYFHHRLRQERAVGYFKRFISFSCIVC